LEYSQRAYELRDRLTDRERMHVEAIYYFRQYDMQRAAEVYDVLLAQYPDDDLALNNLGVLTGDYLGDYERAYRAYLEAMALNPYSASRYGNAINAAYKVDRLDVADSLIALASARGFEEHVARWSRRHAVALGDVDRADALCDSLLEEAASAARFADRRSSCGSISAARGRIGEAIDRMEAAGQFYGEQLRLLDYSNVVLGVALAEQIRGRPTAARARLEAALDRFPADSIREFARVVYRTTLSVGAGLLGHTDLQERLAETYPEPSGAARWTIAYGDAMVSAARSLAEGDPDRALAALQDIEALGYELGGWLGHAHLMHALAFEELADLNAEVVQLEEMIHPGLRTQAGSWTILTLTQLPFALRRLAELEEARGNTDAAIRHYQTFLDLWSDPDPELRDQVTSAQRALARLTGTESS
jgi:tetratricopeptide (TPR) repeat protein